MKTIHRLAFTYDSRIRAFVTELGLPFEEGYFCVCKINENDPRWHTLSEMLKLNNINEFESGDMVHTEFTKKELSAAPNLAIYAKGHTGYPEPSDDMSYMELTYNLDDYCAKCGMGAYQKAPFRFKKAPVWGQKNIMQLNWVFDEFFVTPEIWRDLFEPFGIGCRPVVLNKSGRELDTVVQLDITELVDLSSDDLADAPFETCVHCGRLKYLPIGRFDPAPGPTSAPMFRSKQFFGSGGAANRLVMVSNAVYAKAQTLNLRGVGFSVCVKV
jgi:rRNA maturation protein Nop10